MTLSLSSRWDDPMKVKCIANTGKDLLEKTLTLGYSTETMFDLCLEQIYTVYGICIWRESLHYMLKGEEHSFPSWYPAELFTVTDHLMPSEWYFEYCGSACDITTVWGYKELVLDGNHFDDLMERNNEALGVFLKRKQEIDENL
jgi:hypothetical protein